MTDPRPVFFQIPANYAEMTEEERETWSNEIADQIVANTPDEHLPEALRKEKRRAAPRRS
jgi:hypothetical protein